MDMMDIQPPKRRPVPPPRPRPKIQLESTRFAQSPAPRPVEPAQPQNAYTQPQQQIPPQSFAQPAPAPVSAPAPQPIPTRPVPMQATHPHISQAQPQPQPEPFSEPEHVAETVQAPKQKRQKKLKQPKQKRSHKKLWATLAIIVLLLAAGGAGGFLYLRSKMPQAISRAFVKDLQSNNPQAAYDLTSNAFKTATSESSLGKLFSQVSANLQGQVTVADTNLKNAAPNQAIIAYKIDTDNGTKYVRVVLQKNAKWQVLNFRSSDTSLNAQQVN